jgi:hypothetical protein
MNQERFLKAGKPWSQEEDVQLVKLYKEDNLDVLKISEIHQRGGRGIIVRLRNLHIIEKDEQARGYDEYLKFIESKDYQEYLSSKKEARKTIKKEQSQDEIQNLRKEIEDLRIVIKEVVYELLVIKNKLS